MPKSFFQLVLAVCLLVIHEAAAAPPNLIIILCDDLGYGDLGCYGNKTIKTPHIDTLAAAGARFTDFYCCAAQCTPSRAGLLTGRYAIRTKLTFALMTGAGAGMAGNEITLPEALKKQGYTTMLSGKWHLGDQPQFHPTKHGFDQFFGLLRGHDTDPRELWQNNRIIEKEATAATLTGRFTDSAVDFINKNKSKPFFLMLAHTSPHVPLEIPLNRRGKSAGGAYGDSVEEIDDSVGRIIAAIEANKLTENTLIVFTSDNGPAIDKGAEGGSTGGLRAGKYSTFEGGMRVPAMMAMPGKIKARIESTPATLLDLFPTFIAQSGGKPPADRPIDGRDLSALLMNQGKREGDEIFMYVREDLQAMRQGKWKLKLGDKAADPAMLFDLEKDAAEVDDQSVAQPQIVKQMRARMSAFEKQAR